MSFFKFYLGMVMLLGILTTPSEGRLTRKEHDVFNEKDHKLWSLVLLDNSGQPYTRDQANEYCKQNHCEIVKDIENLPGFFVCRTSKDAKINSKKRYLRQESKHKATFRHVGDWAKRRDYEYIAEPLENYNMVNRNIYQPILEDKHKEANKRLSERALPTDVPDPAKDDAGALHLWNAFKNVFKEEAPKKGSEPQNTIYMFNNNKYYSVNGSHSPNIDGANLQDKVDSVNQGSAKSPSLNLEQEKRAPNLNKSAPENSPNAPKADEAKKFNWATKVEASKSTQNEAKKKNSKVEEEKSAQNEANKSTSNEANKSTPEANKTNPQNEANKTNSKVEEEKSAQNEAKKTNSKVEEEKSAQNEANKTNPQNEANKSAPEANKSAQNEANKSAPEANKSAQNEVNKSAQNEVNKSAQNEVNKSAQNEVNKSTPEANKSTSEANKSTSEANKSTSNEANKNKHSKTEEEKNPSNGSSKTSTTSRPEEEKQTGAPPKPQEPGSLKYSTETVAGTQGNYAKYTHPVKYSSSTHLHDGHKRKTPYQYGYYVYNDYGTEDPPTNVSSAQEPQKESKKSVISNEFRYNKLNENESNKPNETHASIDRYDHPYSKAFGNNYYDSSNAHNAQGYSNQKHGTLNGFKSLPSQQESAKTAAPDAQYSKSLSWNPLSWFPHWSSPSASYSTNNSYAQDSAVYDTALWNSNTASNEHKTGFRMGESIYPPNDSRASSFYSGYGGVARDSISQWHILNRGFNGKYAGNDLNIINVWDSGVNGSGVTIAIIDAFFDIRHEEIRDMVNLSTSKNLATGDLTFPEPTKQISGHGTKSSGLIFGRRGGTCSIGTSHGSLMSAVVVPLDDMNDYYEASAFSHANQQNDVYVISWGPPDDGKTIARPRRMAQNALENGIKNGRRGLGNIFVVAAGNGYAVQDNCNYDGYANSPYTIAIGSITNRNARAPYSEQCSSILAVTYSGGGDEDIRTIDVNNTCTNSYTGTSASAPIASGIIGLMLSVRPDLGWRDIQQIIVSNASKVDPYHPSWLKNAAGNYFSHIYGYGSMDATKLVNAARSASLLPDDSFILSKEADSVGSLFRLPGINAYGVSSELVINASEASYLEMVETVEVTIQYNHPRRGDLRIELISPGGTVSTLATPRPADRSTKGLNWWTFTTVFNWGESPIGTWRLMITDTKGAQKRLTKSETVYDEFVPLHYEDSKIIKNDKASRDYAHPTELAAIPFEWTIGIHGTCTKSKTLNSNGRYSCPSGDKSREPENSNANIDNPIEPEKESAAPTSSMPIRRCPMKKHTED